jgi:regulator of nucleoside diphosphate kinase
MKRSTERNRRIVITKDDLELLLRLSGHPRLAEELKLAEVVDATAVAPDVVTMNSRVLYEDETLGERREITVVYPREADTSRRRVSVLGPTGMALLGLRAGESIDWRFPDGSTRRLRVLRVADQPEAETAPRRRLQATAALSDDRFGQ